MAVSVLSSQGQVQQCLGLTNAPDAQNKSIVLVKLTDSSLEALTNYIKNATSASTKPTINFSNNTGTFTVPISGEGGNLKLQKFNFSLSSNQESGPQASFECLESRRPDSLESLGPVKHKAQVQASERSFEKFREQLGDVKREQQNRTSRILDKSKIGGVSASGRINGKPIVSRKHILANKSLESSGRSNDLKLNKYSHTHGHGSRSQSQQPSPPPLIKNGCHPLLDRNKHKNKPNHNPEIMKRTLRERIVHLLAVRPLKKPELMDRIDIRDKEKKDLFPLVKQVSIMKDNTYHLRKDVWNDVSEDWPFYTEEERQAFLRQKPQNLTPPGSDGGSSNSVVSGHSSSSSHPSSPQQVLKRSSAYPTQGGGSSSSPLSDNLEKSTSPVAKKKRVSNFMKPTNSLSPMSSLGRSPNNRSPSAPVLPPAAPEEESKVNAWLRGSMESPERPLTRAQLKTNHQDVDKSFPSRKIMPDFTTKFVSIGCREQRQAYKAEFDKDYSRYKILHSELDRVSQRFANLQQQLRHTPEASPDHQRLKKMIVKEYQTANDSQIKRDREEFHYLHKKLEHIKKLVHDYDTEHPKQPRPALIKST